MREICSRLAGLALAAVACWPLPALAKPPAAELGEEFTLCGHNFWFAVAGPKGWSATPGNELDDQYVKWTSDSGALVIARLHAAGRMEASEYADPRSVLRQQVSLLRLMGAVGPIRDVDVRHPTLPSAAARVTGEAGSLTVVAIVAAAEQERSLTWAVMLVTPEKVPSAEQLRALSVALESLRFKPDVGCSSGFDGPQKEIPYSRTRALPRPPPSPPGAKRPFDARDALRGAIFLERMFVGLTATNAQVAGEPALLIDFVKSGDVEKYASYVASSYCWEASSAPPSARVPPLYFATKEPDRVRRWDCAKESLGDSAQATITRVSPVALMRSHTDAD